MSDSKRVYHEVFKALKRALKSEPQHRVAVLAMMITALVRGSSAQLSKMAGKAPSRAKNQSTFRRNQRWLANPHVQVEAFYMPFASSILSALKRSTLYLAMDASSTARGCQTLMLGVIYKKRLLPLCWLTYEGKKGHAPCELHIEALEKLAAVIPKDANVVLLADGEYDNIGQLEWIEQNTNWKYVIRTAKNSQLEYRTKVGKTRKTSIEKALMLSPDTLKSVMGAKFTGEKYGPVNVVGVWERGNEEPIYLLTTLDTAKKAADAYKKRYIIETLFSDQKGRGFGIDKSHISNPERLSRLLLATSLAYIWMVYFGVLVLKEELWDLIDHTRQDKSLFRLGMDWIDHVLNQELEFRAIFFIRGVM